MKTHNVISSGSTGNAVLYHDCVLVDCGVPFSKIEPFLKQISLVLLTHKHKDHLNMRTLKRIQWERPAVRIGLPEHLITEISELNNVDVYKIGKVYDYQLFKLSPFQLYHDVPNVGYRIFKDNHKIFHATDTAHLNGITAKNYDLYAIEHNYDEEKLKHAKEICYYTGEFTHAFGSEQTHLSWQQARAFIEANKKETSQILELHKSKSFY